MTDAFFFSDPFRQLYRLYGSPTVRSGYGSAPMDWIETPTSYIFRFDVPGFGKEDIKVELEEGNVLVVRGEMAKARKEAAENEVWIVAERDAKVGFERRIAMPENARADQIRAQVENGVLTVAVTKEQPPAKPKPRSIPVSSKL